MIRRAWIAVSLVVALLSDIPASKARDNQLFTRQSQAVVQPLPQGTVELRHWGGPTTHSNWWTPTMVHPPVNIHVGGGHRGSHHNVYNYYYFAPFSYPRIYNGLGWVY
jgi:hypothetical protein